MRDPHAHFQGIGNRLESQIYAEMTVDEIKELIQVVNESGIAELEVARGDNRVRIRRSNAAPAQEIILPATPLTVAPTAATPTPIALPLAAPPHTLVNPAAPAITEPENLTYVK